MKKKNILKTLGVGALCLTGALAFSGCGFDNSKNENTAESQIQAVYNMAVEAGYTGTYEDWLATIKGEKGDKGDQGIQGIQGEKGDKGDQGTQGIQGIQGVQGIQGEQGEKGDKGEKGDAAASIVSIKSNYSSNHEYIYMTYYMSDGTIRYSELEVPKTYTFTLNAENVAMYNVPDRNRSSYPWLKGYFVDQFGNKTEVENNHIFIDSCTETETGKYTVNVSYWENVDEWQNRSGEVSYATFTALYRDESVNPFVYGEPTGDYELGYLPNSTNIFENNHFYGECACEVDGVTYTYFREITEDMLQETWFGYSYNFSNYYNNYFTIHVNFYKEATWREIYTDLDLSYSNGYILKANQNFPEFRLYTYWSDYEDEDLGATFEDAKQDIYATVKPSMILNQEEFNYTIPGKYNVKILHNGKEYEFKILIYDPMINNISYAYYGEDEYSGGEIFISPIAKTQNDVSAIMLNLVEKGVYIGLYNNVGLVYRITLEDLSRIDFSEVNFYQIGMYNAYLDLNFDKSNETNEWKGSCRVKIPILVQPQEIIASEDDMDYDHVVEYLNENSIDYVEYSSLNEDLEYYTGVDKLIFFNDHVFIYGPSCYITSYTKVGNIVECNVGYSDSNYSYTVEKIKLELNETTHKFSTIKNTGNVVNTYYLNWDVYEGYDAKIIEYDNGYVEVYNIDGDEENFILTMTIHKDGDMLKIFGSEVKIVKELGENVYELKF